MRITLHALGRLATAVALPLLQACGSDGPSEAVPPTFHEVVTDVNGPRTGYRVDEEDARWEFFRHDDELDELWCADLAVAPDGVMRHLAFLHQTSDGRWMLSVRAGLGPSTWSTTFSGVEVPEIEDPEGFPVSACQRLRIVPLTDDRYGIVWVANGAFHTAVYEPGRQPPSDLVLGEPVPFDLQGIDARRVSPVWSDDALHVVWSAPDSTRILTMRGTLGSAGLQLGPGATFTALEHEELSDVVSLDGTLHVAVRRDGALRLYATSTGGTGWEEISACETDAGIRGKLLFVDAAGDLWVAETTGQFDNRLRRFTDCSIRPFPLAVTSGKLTYHPGSG